MKYSEARKLLSCVWICILSMTANAFTLYSDTTETGRYNHFPYIRIVSKDATITTPSDEAFADSAAKIIFPVNKYSLPIHSTVLKELGDTVIPMLNSDSLTLRKIYLRGAASPEGPTQWNKTLGVRRAQSLLDFLTNRLQFPVDEDILETVIEIEDYRTLCLLMRRNGDPDYPLVQMLCDQYSDKAALKQQLQRVRHGKLWPRLLYTYFPQLRAARMLLFFNKTASPTPVPADTTTVTPPIDETEPVDTTVVIPTDTVAVDTVYERVPRRELLSIKTNLLLDGAYMPGYNRWCPIPNLAVEYYPKRGHFTYGASLDIPWWQHYQEHKYFQIRNYQVEGRWWARGAHGDDESFGNYRAPAYRGAFLQAYLHVAVFGICFDENRGWVGEGAGAGVGAGYVLPISHNGHWRLEFSLQAGFFRCKYDPYQYENPVNPAYRDHLYYYKWTQKPELFKKRQYR